jgi:hypothetical protein
MLSGNSQTGGLIAPVRLNHNINCGTCRGKDKTMRFDKPYCSVCGEPARGTLELTPGLALLLFDEDGEAEYEGGTTMDRDGQKTCRDKDGQVILECRNGHRWQAKMCEDGAPGDEAAPAGCLVCGKKTLAFPHPQPTCCSAECFLIYRLGLASVGETPGDSSSKPTPAGKSPAKTETFPKDRSSMLNDLLDKTDGLGLQSSDLEATVHDLAASIAADVNNAGTEDQLGYLLDEMGFEAVERELDRLAAEKARGSADDDE